LCGFVSCLLVGPGRLSRSLTLYSLILSVDDLELSDGTVGPKVLACRDLTTDTLWGPYTGIVQSEEAGDDQVPEVRVQSAWR
jgi:hypothetical protein